MPGLKFNCPHCQQPLEAPEAMFGQEFNCPACNGALKLPSPPAAESASPSPADRQTQACPFCGEDILQTAIKCKHCGEFLDGRAKQPNLHHPKKAGFQIENEMWKGKPSHLCYLAHYILGALLLLVFGLGLLFILYALLDRNTRIYTLTNRRVMSKAGIISRNIHEVGLKDIRNINLKQGIMERLFGLGTVEIASAGTAGVEVRFVGVRDPMRVRDLVRREKDEADSHD